MDMSHVPSPEELPSDEWPYVIARHAAKEIQPAIKAKLEAFGVRKETEILFNLAAKPPINSDELLVARLSVGIGKPCSEDYVRLLLRVVTVTYMGEVDAWVSANSKALRKYGVNVDEVRIFLTKGI